MFAFALASAALPGFSEGLKKGAAAPDFSIALPGGGSASLGDYRGKTLFLHFWATWCGPCRQELPHLDAAAKKISGGKSAAFLAVCVSDSEKDRAKFMRKNGYTFSGGLDESGEIAAEYGVYAIPATIVISPEGTVLEIITGAMPETKIDALLEKYSGL